jgi:hypothetical protein
MTGRHRTLVAGLILLGILVLAVLVAFAGNACPTQTEAQTCPDAGRNRAIVIALAGAGLALLVAPFAFMGEVLARRRIVYRGAWGRAARRGILAGLVLSALAGLRLGGVLGVPTALFVVVVAAAIEWFFVRNDR